MPLTVLLLLVPLACLIVVPLVRMGSRPSPRLQQLLAAPWRAAGVLALANLAILTVTAALFVGLNVLELPGGTLLPVVVGPALGFAAWTRLGMAMPLSGAPRWSATAIGMSPYLLLAAGAWLWTLSIPEGGPGDDPFMAWLGGVMLMVVSTGAAVLGTLVTGLVRIRSA